LEKDTAPWWKWAWFLGYYATKSAYKPNQVIRKTPIIDAVYEILYEGKDAEPF
jgi:glycerol-3-phosphate dehydrogenase